MALHRMVCTLRAHGDNTTMFYWDVLGLLGASDVPTAFRTGSLVISRTSIRLLQDMSYYQWCVRLLRQSLGLVGGFGRSMSPVGVVTVLMSNCVR